MGGLHADAPRSAPCRGRQDLPSAQKTPNNVLLAWADKLPFAPNSIDYIVRCAWVCAPVE